jgi:hypothetical protein
MRAFVATLVCAALVAGGATLAIASGGGHTHGSPAHHQYKPKPPCKPHHGKPKHRYGKGKHHWGGKQRARGSRKARTSTYKGRYNGRGHCPKPKPHRR